MDVNDYIHIHVFANTFICTPDRDNKEDLHYKILSVHSVSVVDILMSFLTRSSDRFSIPEIRDLHNSGSGIYKTLHPYSHPFSPYQCSFP